MLHITSHSTLFESIQINQESLGEQSTPYRDNPLTLESSPSDQPYDGPSNTDILQSQQQQIYSQDNQLDSLSASIGRQHHLSLQMNEELQTHADLLDEMDAAVDSTSARLGRASRKLDVVTRSLKEHGEWSRIV
jgi:syntaxin 8